MANYTYGIEELIKRYPELKSCKQDIISAFEVLKECYSNEKKLLIAGNGGSCSDAEHIVGELMKGFKYKRSLNDNLKSKLISADSKRGTELAAKLQGALPAIALDGHQGLNTAFANDVENGGLLTFAQQTLGYGNFGDVLLAISTSGNSQSVMYAVITAKAKGMKVIGLTGKDGGELAKYSDVAIIAPSNETFMIQEYHLPIYHCLCLMLEQYFFES